MPLGAAVSPNTGPVAGNGAVTVFGGGLGDATTVTFGSAGAGQIVARSVTSLTVIPPAAPGPDVRGRHRGQPTRCLGHLGGRPLRVRRGPQLRAGLPIRGLRRRDLRFRGRGLPRVHRQPGAEPAHRRHGDHARAPTATGWSPPTAASSHSAMRPSSARRAASTSTGPSWAWPPRRTAGATGWSPPTAASSPTATRPSSARRATSTSTGPSWAWPPRRTAAATGWWPPTAASSPTAMRPSSARPATPSQLAHRGHGRHLSGGGYWLVASDGGIFTYGDAPLLRLGRQHPSQPAPSWAWRPRPTGAATGWWPPTAASSPTATPSSTGPRAASC